MAELLIGKGADINVKDGVGRCAWPLTDLRIPYRAITPPCILLVRWVIQQWRSC